MAQRYCTNCGSELPEGVRFCGSCGSPAHRTASVSTEGARVDVPPPPMQTAPPVRGGGGAIMKLAGLLTLIVVVFVGFVLPFLVGFFQGVAGAL